MSSETSSELQTESQTVLPSEPSPEQSSKQTEIKITNLINIKNLLNLMHERKIVSDDETESFNIPLQKLIKFIDINTNKETSEDNETVNKENLLNVNDLINIRILLQLMINRGGILAEEATVFGHHFDALNKFLLDNVPNAPSLLNPPKDIVEPSDTSLKDTDSANTSEKPSNTIVL